MITKVYPITICILIMIAVTSVSGKPDRYAGKTGLYKPTARETRRSYIYNCCGNDTCSGQGTSITNLKPINVQPTGQNLHAISSNGSADGPGANEGGTENQQEGTDPPGQEIGTESPDLNQNDEPSASFTESSDNPEPDSATIKMEKTLKPLAGAPQPEQPFRTRP
ncbi:uncharacterized protein LOC135937271 [Cloeon dipterum]|uniref:uncharacterized protein LOC135937271 n=1 Tax=Cloeon dipterum TaxID=197152 RepID=UPI00321F8F8C